MSNWVELTDDSGRPVRLNLDQAIEVRDQPQTLFRRAETKTVILFPMPEGHAPNRGVYHVQETVAAVWALANRTHS